MIPPLLNCDSILLPMHNNSSRFWIQNSSCIDPLSQSQLPVQTYSLKLQNNKPVKLFIRVRNDTTSSYQAHTKTIDFVQKLSHVFTKARKQVFQQCKEMMVEEEQYSTQGPSLLQEMMRSEIPIRNGSFMQAPEAFSMIRPGHELNNIRDSRHSNHRNTLANTTKLIPGILKINDLFDASRRKQQRTVFGLLEQWDQRKSKQLMSRVMNKIASSSLLNLETSILRLKNVSAATSKPPEPVQFSQICKDQVPQDIAALPIEEAEGVQSRPLKECKAKQQRKRMQCFVTILQNADRKKTFESLNQAFALMRRK